MLNKTDLAAPLGVSIPTITQWLNILEVTGQIALVPPFYENLGQRLVKTPKLFFLDSGLLCHLLGVLDRAALARSPFRGVICETFVAAEILKHRLHRGRPRGLYYFRDRLGLEVDFVVDEGNNNITLLEVKATRTPMPADARPALALMGCLRRYKKNVRTFVVYDGLPGQSAMSTLCEGARAVSWTALHDIW